MAIAWRKGLEAFLCPAAVLVGVGNRLRGDDAFGPRVLDRLRGRVGWPFCDVGEAPENHIGNILAHRPQCVLLLDAVRWGRSPGTIGFFRAKAVPFGGCSVHRPSLRLVLELLSHGGRCRTALLGVEPEATAFGAPLSVAVARSIERVAKHVVRLARCRGMGLDAPCAGHSDTTPSPSCDRQHRSAKAP